MLENPVGIEGTPYFSWRMESDVRGQAQTAYRIILAKDSSMTDLVWDSEKTESSLSVGIKCGAALESLTKYCWQTGVWDKDGNYAESGTATFETGLLDSAMWSSAEWIQVGDEPVPQRLISKLIGKEDVYDADNQAETIEYIYMVRDVLNTITKLFPKPAAIVVMTVFDWVLCRELKNFGSSTFRKEFRTENGIESAKLHITGRGIFDASINGKRVGAIRADSSTVYDELKPGYTDADKRAFYFTYDVTPLLSESGNNAISATVGNSWWRDAIVSKRGSQNILKAKLFIRYTDGTTQEVATDNTWKTKTTGPVLASTIYDGEVYDANASTAWQTGGFDDSGWADAELNNEFTGAISSAAIGARVRVRDDLTLAPSSVTVSCGVLPVLAKGYGNVIELAKYTGGGSFVLKKGQTAVVDFGQNFAGWTQITATGPKGTVIKMRHAEMLNEKDGLINRGNDGPGGSIYVKNLRGAEAKAIYIMNGKGEETYHPTFTYTDIQ